MAHIVIDARIINSSTGTYVQRLLHHLQQIDREHQYTVLVPTKDLTFWQPTNPRFTVQGIDVKNYSLTEQLGFRRQLDSLDADLVHFCMPQQPILYRGRTVTTVHDLTLLRTYNSDKNWFVFRFKQLIGRGVFRRIARTNRHIITPSEYTRREYIEFSRISPERVTVTYEAAEPAIGVTEPYPLPSKRYLLYVGAQSDYKNIRRLAAAHQKLRATRPELGLVLVGRQDAAARANEAHFTEQGYQGIVFTGFLPDAQRNWLYQHADAYVFPSLMEGFGLPGLEAMAHGAPVASSNATCLPEIYGSAARYFDPTDTDQMAATIAGVIDEEAVRQALISAGTAQLKKYSWRRMAQQTLNVYNEALMPSDSNTGN